MAGAPRRPWARSSAGVVLLGAFVVAERRVTHPLVPLGIIADRTRGPAYLGALISGIGLIGAFLLITYYLQGVLGFSPLRAGLAFLPFIVGVVIAANFVSNVGLKRIGPKVIVPVGMILGAGAAVWLTGLGVQGDYGTRVAPALVLLGLGTGAVVTIAFGLGPAGARAADSGVAAALVNSSNQVGGSLGAALLNTIAASAAANYLSRPPAARQPAVRHRARRRHRVHVPGHPARRRRRGHRAALPPAPAIGRATAGGRWLSRGARSLGWRTVE